MNKQQLKAFRAKLVKARDWERKHLAFPMDSNVIEALRRVGIPTSADVNTFVCGVHKFTDHRKAIGALFSNSIAAIDAQIRSKP